MAWKDILYTYDGTFEGFKFFNAFRQKLSETLTEGIFPSAAVTVLVKKPGDKK